MAQNNGKIFLSDMVYQNVMKRSSKVKSLKLFHINNTQNTYKYIVFLYCFYVPYYGKQKKHMKVDMIKIIEILVYLVRGKFK